MPSLSRQSVRRGLRDRKRGSTLQSGFTLIEVLVVIAIIGILLSILLMVIPKVYQAAYKARTQAQLSAIGNAINMYKSDLLNGSYPGPLDNTQIDVAQDPTGNSTVPFILNKARQKVLLTGIGAAASLDPTKITGTENMVLGLLGGLKAVPTGNSGAYDVAGFVYDPTIIYPDGKTAAPAGASSLSVNNPRQQQSYIQIRPGDLSVPNYAINNGGFVDDAGRPANDSCIPEFLDKFGKPLPILCLRTNPGGKAIAGVRNTDGNGNLLIDTYPQQAGNSSINAYPPQYDLLQVVGYTATKIGTNAEDPKSYHGLQGLGASNLTDLIVQNGAPTNNGSNALAYLRDPNFKVDPTNPNASYNPNASNTHAGHARNPNGFMLISAGPDRLYGTPDDIVFPGEVTSPQ